MIDEVPVEVLEYIFSYLPLISMFPVSVVNTTWRACCDTRLLYNLGQMILRVPHLRTLLDTNIDIDLQELLIATEKSYLILGGEDDDEHLKKIISKTGLTVDTWNPINFNASNIFGTNVDILGDMLTEYLEEGYGGVIQTVFTFSSSCPGGKPGGAYHENKYCPVEPKSQTTLGRECSLVKDSPNHFLFTGVNHLTMPKSAACCPNNKLRDDLEDTSLASIIGRFDNAHNTVAVVCRELQGKNKGRICVLNYYPASNACPGSWTQNNCWHSDTDGAELLANALLYCGIKTNRIL
jgi:hypothetical protein